MPMNDGCGLGVHLAVRRGPDQAKKSENVLAVAVTLSHLRIVATPVGRGEVMGTNGSRRQRLGKGDRPGLKSAPSSPSDMRATAASCEPENRLFCMGRWGIWGRRFLLT